MVKRDDNAKTHLPLTRVDRDEQCLYAAINRAETDLEPLTPALVGRAAALFTISSPVTGINATPMKTDIFRALNITSVPADGQQTED